MAPKKLLQCCTLGKFPVMASIGVLMSNLRYLIILLSGEAIITAPIQNSWRRADSFSINLTLVISVLFILSDKQFFEAHTELCFLIQTLFLINILIKLHIRHHCLRTTSLWLFQVASQEMLWRVLISNCFGGNWLELYVLALSWCCKRGPYRDHSALSCCALFRSSLL